MDKKEENADMGFNSRGGGRNLEKSIHLTAISKGYIHGDRLESIWGLEEMPEVNVLLPIPLHASLIEVIKSYLN